LPDSEEMWSDIRREKLIHEAIYPPSDRRYINADYYPYMDELGNMIGCSPPNFCQFILLLLNALFYLLLYLIKR